MKAVTLSGDSGPDVRVAVYGQFKGVDFSTDPLLVDESRSPYALNLISDTGGMPEKRPGWRVLMQLPDKERIRGIWRCEIEGEEHWLCKDGSGFYKLDMANGTYTSLYVEDVISTDSKVASFWMKGKLYFLTGSRYLVYDGKTIELVEGYVPTTVVNRAPDGGGGSSVDGYNLIQPKWCEEFIGDGSAKEYVLSDKGLDSTEVECEIYNATTKEWEKKTEGTDFTVDREKGTVTFNTAPKDSVIPNVRLKPSKTREGYADKVHKAKACAVYNDEVVFLAGAEKGIDYRSAFGRPDYFPDTGYDRVGTDETDIMGYCKIGEYLGIVKESNSQDNTIYLRWSEQQTTYDADGKSNTTTVYKKKQGVVGVGAISRQCIGQLLDEPLFLSDRGVFAVTSNAVTFERTVQNRSFYVDRELTAEEGLGNAVGVEWKGYYIVAVNGRCYVLDSRQKSYRERSSSEFVYECYYWDNIPASCWLAVGDDLYFGTEDGRICKFNTDLDFYSTYNDDGAAIRAIWSTKSDDDGYPQYLKTMQKKGSAVTIKPFSKSGARVYIRTEKDPVEKLIREGAMDIMDFGHIDFARFTFNSNDAPQDIMLRKKKKKYKRLRFYVVNDDVGEGFGIFRITKHYTVLSPAKK